MTTPPPLAGTYGEARDAFRAAAAGAGARLESTTHPLAGPDGELLTVDVAELGPHDAADVVLVVSGTHGVEGFCGSELQRAWLDRDGGERPAATRVVLVHALNPVGFAWVRRVNEDNVDLNRNFVDWSAPLPSNPDYDRIAALLVPPDWSEESLARTTDALFAVAGEWGFERMQAVVSGGQYAHPTGVFYGGAGPVWSHRWLRAWAAVSLAAAERLRIVDLHTGLGPWGVGELITSVAAADPAHRRAAALWGDVRSAVDGESVSAALSGDWLAAAAQLAPRAEVTGVGLEFGTVDPVVVLQALRADAWLHAHGEPRGPHGDRVREQVRAAFADDAPAWMAACGERFTAVMGAALSG